MKKEVKNKVIKTPKIKVAVKEENMPVEVSVDIKDSTATSTNFQGTDVIVKQESTSVPQETVSLNAPRKTYFYPIPETKEDYLALHKCLKDLGVNSIGDLEIRASRL